MEYFIIISGESYVHFDHTNNMFYLSSDLDDSSIFTIRSAQQFIRTFGDRKWVRKKVPLDKVSSSGTYK